MTRTRKIAFVASESPEARAAEQELVALYGRHALAEADTVVALGGDGLMLQTLHSVLPGGHEIYGMHRGSVGFLMNDYAAQGLLERLDRAEGTAIHPLRMKTTTMLGDTSEALAFNEVSMLRQRHQAAKLRLSVDGQVRLEELICDGIIVATPAGSTAYNLSANGPILPINSPLLAVTPLSAFRPRRWRGAILPHDAKIGIEVLEAEKRPVAAVADHEEVREVHKVEIMEDQTLTVRLMFDPGHTLAERVLAEQFRL